MTHGFRKAQTHFYSFGWQKRSHVCATLETIENKRLFRLRLSPRVVFFVFVFVLFCFFVFTGRDMFSLPTLTADAFYSELSFVFLRFVDSSFLIDQALTQLNGFGGARIHSGHRLLRPRLL